MKKRIAVEKEQLEKFGKRVRSIREHLRLKQKKFAAELEISEGYICQVEKGNANPTYEFFYKLAKRHNVSIDYLIYGQGNLFYKSKIPGEDEEPRDSIDTVDDLYWYIENSGVFRMGILVESVRWLYDNADLIKKDLEHERKKRKK